MLENLCGKSRFLFYKKLKSAGFCGNEAFLPIFLLRGVKKELCLPVGFLIVSAGFLILSASAIRLLADSLIVSVNILILLFCEKGSALGICMNIRQ